MSRLSRIFTKRNLKWFAGGGTLLFLLLMPSACSTVSYYSQAARGHLDLMKRRQPIEDVLSDQALDPLVRQKLEAVQKARLFAVTELGLPDNKSYQSYADLQRPFVVWNIFATEEFSVDAKTWCYLIVGCLGYRGYYAEDRAQAAADALRATQHDVFVGGVPAYSTLGRFADPVLNTMLNRSDLSLAELLFHELTHQRVYRAGDSEFSESLASFVQQEGVLRYLSANNKAQDIEKYQLRNQRSEQFVELLSTVRNDLRVLYAKPLPVEEMRKQKAARFAQLKSDYQVLRQQWGGYPGYDAWFARSLNNAHLLSIATYHRLLPAFQVLLNDADGDLEVFWQRAAELAELSKEELHSVMEQLLLRATAHTARE